MITEAYDLSKPKIIPEITNIAGNFSDVCICTFSKAVLDYALAHLDMEVVNHTSTANGDIYLYQINYNEKKILFYMSPITAPIAATLIDEMRVCGGFNKIISFGSCGVLQPDVVNNRVIVPTECYRDEGLSYHYMEPTDYIKINNADKLAEMFEQLQVPYIKGRNWTTDAIYMETENKINKRVAEGCLSVEMESSALQALCNYRNLDFYNYFFAGDIVSDEKWNRARLGNQEEYDCQVEMFLLALKIAEMIGD